jgi:exopolysaccharide biosynthesis polyprenyl glycosylphosphotransferase
MKKKSGREKDFKTGWRRFTTVAVFISITIAGMSWANSNLIKTIDGKSQIEESKSSQVLEDVSRQKYSRVPEPSTLALFGSGILSMVIAFLRKTYNITKRVMDLTVAVLALLILSPLCLLVALLIKLTSKGPVFYSQVRSGKDGKFFDIYKFRTMKVDAEKESGPVWAKSKDDRITPVGNFLRKSRIDEIPQFINVLQGDMSIIGPRPERPVFIEKLKDQISDYPKRLSIKPGITGLAQVHHRYDESIADVRKKVKYDILYIKKMCFWTDLRIMGRTLGVILTGFGAY